MQVSPSLWRYRATEERVYHDKLTIEIAPNNVNMEADNSVTSSAPASFDPDTLERNLERRHASDEGILFRQFYSLINRMFRSNAAYLAYFLIEFCMKYPNHSKEASSHAASNYLLTKVYFAPKNNFGNLRQHRRWVVARIVAGVVAIVVLGVVGMKYDNKYADS